MMNGKSSIEYLSDWPYIKTESEGEGSRRHLKIMY